MNILNAKDHPEAFLTVETDRAAAFVMGDIPLYSMVGSAKAPTSYQISAAVTFDFENMKIVLK